MRRPSHSPLTSNMRTGTLPFCATCISAITPARWSITRRTAGSFRTTQTSSSGLLIFATAQRKRRSHEKDYHSLDFAWSPWPSARGCTRAASSAAKDESSTGTGRKTTGKDSRAKEGGRKEGGGEDTDRRGAAKDGRRREVDVRPRKQGARHVHSGQSGSAQSTGHCSLEELGTRQWPQRLNVA